MDRIMAAPVGNQFARGNPGGGRPSTYDPKYCTIARKLCELGATDDDLAEALGVSERTIRTWMVTHEDFSAACRVGKQATDDLVERRFYERAVGYTYDAVKVFMPAGAVEPVYARYREHVPPDVNAARFWLQNRRPDRWREKQLVDPVTPEDSPIARMIAACMGTGIRPKEG